MQESTCNFTSIHRRDFQNTEVQNVMDPSKLVFVGDGSEEIVIFRKSIVYQIAMNSHRKLVVVLFADIVGYTAIMQKNEKLASEVLKKFQQDIENVVHHYQGDVVNFYGDGALCTFKLPSKALYCARKLQQNFRQDPRIPVRIGIHSGPVTFQNEKIFGDSINVASRIESMAPSGSILCSKKIYDDVKNQPEFQLEKVGKYHFKNVEQRIEVYALKGEGLVFPKRSRLTGKFVYSKNQKRFYTLAGIFGILLVVFFLWKWQNSTNELLPKDIRESRIAILPFKNRTNNPDLDILGDMVADWLTEGLMSMDNLKVVSYQSVSQNLDTYQAGIENPVFNKITGAQKVIDGNFYLEDSLIVFKPKIIDIKSGNVDKVLSDIKGLSSDLPALVKGLTGKVMGYFAVRDLVELYSVFIQDPPSIEVFREYRRGNKAFGVDPKTARKSFRSAISLAPDFFAPYTTLLISYSNAGQYKIADSILAVIDSRFDNLTASQFYYREWLRSTLNRDLRKNIENIEQIYRRDPKNLLINYLAGYQYSYVNKPLQAIERFQAIDKSVLDKVLTSNVSTWWNEAYAFALIQVNRYQEALQILNLIPNEYANLDKYRLEAQIYIMTDAQEKLDNLLEELELQKKPSTFISNVYLAAAVAYNLKGEKVQQIALAKKASEFLQSQPEGIQISQHDLAESFYYSEQYRKAIPLYISLIEKSGTGSVYSKSGKWHGLSRLGSCYANTQDEEHAREVLTILDQIEDFRPSGKYLYAKARILANLGEKDQALALMKLAMDKGFPNEYGEFRYGEDIDFENLRGLQEFEEFVIQLE